MTVEAIHSVCAKKLLIVLKVSSDKDKNCSDLVNKEFTVIQDVSFNMVMFEKSKSASFKLF